MRPDGALTIIAGAMRPDVGVPAPSIDASSPSRGRGTIAGAVRPDVAAADDALSASDALSTSCGRGAIDGAVRPDAAAAADAPSASRGRGLIDRARVQGDDAPLAASPPPPPFYFGYVGYTSAWFHYRCTK